MRKARSVEVIVLDANILIRAVLGRRVRQLIDQYATLGVRFFAPDVAFADATEHLPAVLKKFGKPIGDLAVSILFATSYRVCRC